MERLSREDETVLAELAGVSTSIIEGPRTCMSRVGTCSSPEHVHPSPNSQMDRVSWMLQQGHTRTEIVEWYAERGIERDISGY